MASVTIDEKFLLSKIDQTESDTGNEEPHLCETEEMASVALNNEELLLDQDPIQQAAEDDEASRRNNQLITEIQYAIDNCTVPDDQSGSNPTACCIYGAPRDIPKETFEKYYVPRVVTIGPIYHKNDAWNPQKFERMEKIKPLALATLIKESNQPLSYYVDFCRGYVDTVRESYSKELRADVMRLDGDEFLRMMLMDGAFVIIFISCYMDSVLFLGYYNDRPKEAVELFPLSPIEDKDILHDLRLLENQLPFCFLQKLNKMFFDNQKSKGRLRMSLIGRAASLLLVLTNGAGCFASPFDEDDYLTHSPISPHHVLDLIRNEIIPAQPEKKGRRRSGFVASVWSDKPIESAKKLKEAGVKFVPVRWPSRECVVFKEDGKLLITCLEIDDATEIIYRNIIAFERQHYPLNPVVTNYLILMELLLRDGSEDLLLKNDVIRNRLSAEGATVAALLKEMLKDINYSRHPFLLWDICDRVTYYCKSPTRRIRAAICGKTWEIGASLLLLLTVLQTIFSALGFFSVTYGRRST